MKMENEIERLQNELTKIQRVENMNDVYEGKNNKRINIEIHSVV